MTLRRTILLMAASTIGWILTAVPVAGQQVVFLDFDSGNDGNINYTTSMRNQIRTKLEEKFGFWDIEFEITNPGGVFSRLTFNEGFAGGVAQHIDFRNIDPDDSAVLNIQGLGASGTAQIIEASATVGAHELGHILGLRHADSFGPIGSGIGNPGPGPGAYLPTFPGPSGGNEVNDHVMATPAFGASNLLRDTFLSERSAIKLEFARSGSLINEVPGSKSTLATAQPISLSNMTVPNTIRVGDNAGLGDFSVDAVSVLSELNSNSEIDIFSFDGFSGDLINVEVMSSAIGHRISSFDTQITLMDDTGSPVTYWGNSATGAFNDDEFETLDSILYDVTLPSDGTYFLQVNSWNSNSSGDYELFVYRFNGEAEEFAICDFDSDGDCDLADVNSMYPEFGGSDVAYDLDGDGNVDDDDLTAWLAEASAVDPSGRTFLRGDANLDGSVLGGDFSVLASNFGAPGDWSDGNFVITATAGGGLVDGPDFSNLAVNFGFTSVSAVPEPNSIGLVLFMLAGLPLARRRR